MKNYSFEYMRHVPQELIDDFMNAIPDPDTWHITRRETYAGGQYLKHSRSIMFRVDDLDNQDMNNINDTKYMEMYPQIKPLMKEVSDVHGKDRFGRVTAAYLPAGKTVYPHKDMFPYLRAITRYIIALTTNPKSYFWCDGVRYHQEQGSMYLFNNQQVHGAKNLGSTGRLHLIVDLF